MGHKATLGADNRSAPNALIAAGQVHIGQQLDTLSGAE